MRLALGTAPPARFIILPMIQPFTPSNSLRSGRSGAFVSASKYVPVGKHVQPARMVESGCEGGHGEPLCADGPSPVGPAAGLRNFDDRHQGALWSG